MVAAQAPMNYARRRILQAGLFGGLGAMTSAAASGQTREPAGSKRVRGVVFMVADGMSHGVIPMADAMSRLVAKRGTHWRELLESPAAAHGLMDTASATGLVTDSAASASAWSCGQRVPNGHVNVTDKGRRLEPIAAAVRAGKGRVGLVTTATVTHATPAGFAACTPDRGDEQGIAPQYLDRADIVLGGGAAYFDAGRRRDKRDLTGEFAKAGYEVVSDRSSLLASRGQRLLGTFASGHLPFTLDWMHDDELKQRVPTLAEMAGAALARLLAGDAPFLLQVEGARVDHGAHANDIGALLWEQLAFDEAIGAVLAAIAGRDDILVVITSDHGNGNPGLNGMGSGYRRTNESFARITRQQASHERVIAEWNKKGGGPRGLAELIERRIGFRPEDAEAGALCDALGGKEVVEWNHLLASPQGLLGQIACNHTGVGWTSTGHTADHTLLTSTGAGSGRFRGLVRNDAVRGILLEQLLG